MLQNSTRSLGILNLERGPQSEPEPTGAVLNPTTFDFPVISETVEGGWAENVVRGDPSLEAACIDAARRLVARGAVAICSNCGFLIRHQAAIASSVSVPVATSSLLLVPTLLRQLPPKSKMAVLTFDSTRCTDDLLGIHGDEERSRIVIGGLEGTKYWHDEHKSPAPPVDVAAIERDLSACVANLRGMHPEIALLLLECTGFPMVAPAIRSISKLPVYDITTLCRMTYASAY